MTKCADCRFWIPYLVANPNLLAFPELVEEWKDYGQCHLHGPTGTFAQWPLISKSAPEAQCGDGKERKKA